MKNIKSYNQIISRFILAGLLAGCPAALRAASTTIYKTDTATLSSPSLDWTAATGGASGAVAPAFGDIGRFDATISAANAAALILGGNVSLDEIQFGNNLNGPVTIANTGGYTLTLGSLAFPGGTWGIDMSAANTNVTLNCNVALGTNGTWSVASAQALTVNGVLSGTAGGGLTLANGGTLNLNGGGAVGGGTVAANYFSVNYGTLNINSGSLTVSPQYRLNVGWNSSPSYLNISNATFTMSANTEVDVGGGYNGAQTTGVGTINIGGTSGTPGKFTLGTTTGSIVLGAAATGTGSGTINLNGYGTLATGRSITSRGLANAAMINFNGGTLQLTVAQSTWIGTGVNVTNNIGGTIDCQTFAGTIVAPINGTGSLTKLGSGALTLSGANTYSGATTVSAGKLVITTASIGGGAFSVANGATDTIKVATAGQTLAMSSLTLGTSAASTLEFDNGALANPTVAIANATSLTLNGTVTVNIYGTALSAGTFDLLAYGSKSGSGTWLLGTLPAGVSATLNDTGTRLQLVVSVANTSVVWKGYLNNIWDVGTILNTNWMNPATLAITFYGENSSGGPAVIFDDTATGSTAVTLGVTVKPTSVTLSNNAAVYSLTGAGSISGSTSLTKNGSGTFTIGTTNNYSGSTTIGGGTLALSGGNNLLPVGTTVAFTTNGALNLGGNSQKLAGLTMAAPSIVYKNSPITTIANGVLTVSGTTAINPATTNLTATLDLSRLSGVYFTNATQTFSFNMNNPTANGTAILNLATNGAGTNFIAAANMNIGAGGSLAAAGGAINLFNLGPWNAFWVSNFTMGSYRQQLETVSFQPGLTTSNLTIMGYGGTNRVANMVIGLWNSGSAYNSGNLIVGAGTFNCSVSNLTLGVHNQGDTTSGRAPLGALDLGAAGNFDCLMLTNGQTWTGASTYAAVVWISQHGGDAHFQTMIMGDNASTSPNCYLQSPYYLNGGTLYAQTIQPGNDGASFSTTSFRGINWTNGTIRNYNSTTPLTITGNGSTLPVSISAPGSGSRYFVVDAGLTNTINGPITQVNGTHTPVVMSGPGTLDLQGTTDNPYLSLNVSNGIVLLDKQSTTTPSVHAVGSGLTINGGSIILAGNGGTGGDQIYDGNLVTLNGGTLDLNGQTETIGGLAGTGGMLADASLGGATLTVNVATGTNYTSAATISHGNLIIGLSSGGGLGTQIFAGTDNRVSETTTINSGTFQIGNGGTGGNLAGSGVTVNSPGFLAFNNSGILNFAGGISGNGSVAQNGVGRLALTGSATYTGNTLVNAGALAIASGATIIGGTPSSITVASNAVFDVIGGAGSFYVQNSQTLNGSGTVTGSYSVANGATNSGNLVVNGNVSFQDGSVLNPGAAATFAAGTLTVNGNVTLASGSQSFIYKLNSASTPGGGTNSLLAISGNLDFSAGNPSLIIQGTPASGTYTLATFGGSFIGSASQLQVPVSGTYTFTPVINGQKLQLVVVGNPKNLVWQGDGGANAWDANNAGNPDWFNTGTSAADFFSTADNVLFNDSSANPMVNISADLLPSSVLVNATTVNYTFAADGGAIDGPIALTKTNVGMLTIQNNNTFSGPVNLNGGVVSVASVDLSANPQPLGDGSTLAFNGGTFQYTGGDVPVNGSAPGFDKQITLGANGGTFDQSGSGYFFLTNQISGIGSFTKIGAGQLILGDTATRTGNNTYSGITYVTNGEVQLRNTNALGSVSGKTVVAGTGDVAAGGGLVGTISEPFDLSGVGSGNGALEANDGGTAVNFAGNINLVADAGIGGGTAFVISGNISGSGSLTKLGNDTVTLVDSNSYTGGTVIGAGTLQLGTNSTTGWIPAQPVGVEITNNGTITFNRADTNAVNDPITGTGSLIQNGSGLTILGGTNTFTGNVTVNGTTNGGVLLVTNAAALGNGTVGVNGGANIGVLQLAGNLDINNNFTLGQKAFLNGNGGQAQPPHITSVSGTNTLFGQITVGAGGNYWGFNSVSGLLAVAAINNNAGGFARPVYLEGAGNGVVTNITDATQNYLQIQKYGAGTWTIAGTADVPQGLQVNAGTLVVDANGIINQDNNANMASAVAGATLVVNGSLAGNVTVGNNGQLGGAGSVAANVTVNIGGTLWPGVNGISTLTVNNNLTLGGNLMMSVNKSLTQSNDFVAVTGVLTNTAAAGTLTVTNLNYLAPLVVGDTFTLFSQPLTNGAALHIVGGGASVTWTNNLALNGSISVLSVTPPVTVNTNTFTITNTVSGNNLNLSWPLDRKGWRLQVQTNSLNSGLRSIWFDWPNSTNLTSVSIPLNPANPTVFLRMIYP